MKSYLDATRWACDQVEERIVDGELEFPECTFADAVVEYSAGIEWVQPEDEDAPSFYVVTDQMAAQLWRLAAQSYEFFDLCKKICAYNLYANAELPKCLRIFVFEVFEDRLKRPTPRHRVRDRNFLEQIFLWSTTKDITRRFGLPLTRNDVSPSHSACDAMAEALSICGRKTNYTEIKHLMVHPDKKRLRDEFLASIRIGSRKNIRGLDPDATAEARALETVRDILGTFPTKQEKSPTLP